MKHLYICLFLLLIANNCFSTVFTIDSQTDFDNALQNATNGDTIEWISGTYTDIFMDITKNDITIQAASIGDVFFNGASKVEIDGDNVTFNGFQYVNGNIDTDHVVRIYGNNVLFTNINISAYSSYKYLIIEQSSKNSVVSYCNFENRINTPDQNILSILVDTTPGYHKIQYCSFKNFVGDPGVSIGDAGVEPIRIGVSTTQNSESKSIVEYCYFTQCNGDGEIISHKATQCVYRYNTFENNPNSELVLRHGGAGIVYGNFFLNGKGGVRIQEASNHILFNNYFSGLTDRSIYLAYDDDVQVNNVFIAYNTVVNSQRVRLGDSGSSNLPPINVTLANNIFSDPANDNGLFQNSTGNEEWFGNITNGTLGITTPSTGTTSVDPLLSLNSEGYYTLAAASPAINNSSDDSPSLFPLPVYSNLDYDNQILEDIILSTRPTLITSKDIGSQEYSASAEVVPQVNADNTGPIYLMPGYDPTLNNNDFITILGSDLEVYPNPLINNELTISFNFNKTLIIEIELYNIGGQKIETLISQTLNAGNNNIIQPINIAAGIYLLQINTKDLSGNLIASKTEKFIKL